MSKALDEIKKVQKIMEAMKEKERQEKELERITFLSKNQIFGLIKEQVKNKFPDLSEEKILELTEKQFEEKRNNIFTAQEALTKSTPDILEKFTQFLDDLESLDPKDLEIDPKELKNPDDVFGIKAGNFTKTISVARAMGTKEPMKHTDEEGNLVLTPKIQITHPFLKDFQAYLKHINMTCPKMGFDEYLQKMISEISATICNYPDNHPLFSFDAASLDAFMTEMTAKGLDPKVGEAQQVSNLFTQSLTKALEQEILYRKTVSEIKENCASYKGKIINQAESTPGMDDIILKAGELFAPKLETIEEVFDQWIKEGRSPTDSIFEGTLRQHENYKDLVLTFDKYKGASDFEKALALEDRGEQVNALKQAVEDSKGIFDDFFKKIVAKVENLLESIGLKSSAGMKGYDFFKENKNLIKSLDSIEEDQPPQPRM